MAGLDVLSFSKPNDSVVGSGKQQFDFCRWMMWKFSSPCVAKVISGNKYGCSWKCVKACEIEVYQTADFKRV